MSEPLFTTTPQDFFGSGYSDLLALATAEHAQAVYRAPHEYSLAAQQAGFDGATLIDQVGCGAQAGVAWSPRAIVVSSRGSSEARDWLWDALSAVRRQWKGVIPPGLRIGAGYRRQAIKLGPPIVEQLRYQRSRYPQAPVYFGGHSLGGSLVPPLVVYAAKAGIRVKSAWPWCSPRVGTPAFAHWYDANFTRAATPTYCGVNVIDGQPDLVTRVPERWMGFEHLGFRPILTGAPRRDGGPGCELVFGVHAWREYLAQNPVSHVQAWRVITRMARSVEAHLSPRLIARLRERAGR